MFNSKQIKILIRFVKKMQINHVCLSVNKINRQTRSFYPMSVIFSRCDVYAVDGLAIIQWGQRWSKSESQQATHEGAQLIHASPRRETVLTKDFVVKPKKVSYNFIDTVKFLLMPDRCNVSDLTAEGAGFQSKRVKSVPPTFNREMSPGSSGFI